HCRDRAPGNRAVHHGRGVRGRDPVGDDPGAVLQVDRRKADFPHGASPSPLRAGGVEGEPGRSALLDHHHDAGPVRTLDSEAPMMREPLFNLLPRPEPVALTGRRVLVLGLGDTGLSVARWIEHQGGTVRVADTRESPPRRGDFAGEVHTGPFSAALLQSIDLRSEEHTSELQSRFDLVCRLLLEKKKNNTSISDDNHGFVACNPPRAPPRLITRAAPGALPRSTSCYHPSDLEGTHPTFLRALPAE